MTPPVKGHFFAHSANCIVALLVLIFVYTSFGKFFDWARFTGILRNQPLPRWMADSLAWGVPSAEIVAAICLLFGPSQRPGLFISLALLSLFTIYIGAILLHFFPGRTPCSCGGIFRHLSWEQHFWVNLGLIGLTGFALIVKKGAKVR